MMITATKAGAWTEVQCYRTEPGHSMHTTVSWTSLEACEPGSNTGVMHGCNSCQALTASRAPVCRLY